MDPIVFWAIKISAYLTVLAQIGALVLILGLVFKAKIIERMVPWSLAGILWITLFSVVFSLFFSGYAGFEPCVLCWYQRIFMFPLPLIAAIGWFRKDSLVFDYILGLGVVGGIIGLYQVYLQFGGPLGFCNFGAVSCTARYVFEFGYVTIPVMSLTSFVLVIALALIGKFRGFLK